MGFHDLVSASEAASISGVSIATLQRFAEVGYLTIESDGDGIPLFSKAELHSVFGIDTSIADRPSPFTEAPGTRQKVSPSVGTPPHTAAPEASEDRPGAGQRMQSLFDLLGKSEPMKGFAGVPPRATSARDNSPHEASPQPELLRWQPISSNTIPPQEAAPLSEHHTNGHTQDNRSPTSPFSSPMSESSPLSRAVEELSAENRKLRHVVDLQEKILTLREAELRDLKEQRDWLRQRLERLEEKSDRDQLLLLSETQTIRKLISLNEPRKSGFQLALEWIGLKPRSSDQSAREGTIELRPAPKKTTEPSRPMSSSAAQAQRPSSSTPSAKSQNSAATQRTRDNRAA